MSRRCSLDNLGLLLSLTGQVSVRDNNNPKKPTHPATNTKHKRTPNGHANKKTQEAQRQAPNEPLSKNTVYGRHNDNSRLGIVGRLS